ncbi:hypothetical protein B7Y94_01635 [Candidatus Saccharibacteria bacterium 32-49-12]|nr:MAG: hypothetical protein B7Y94_01635 [Candidatus Saccharibacteria bacterium 32-49-12]
MNPKDDPQNAQVDMPRTDQQPDRQALIPSRNYLRPQRDAAADLIRGQLDHIYRGGSGENTAHTTPVAQPIAQPATEQPSPTQPSSPATTQNSESGHGLRTAPPEQSFAPQAETPKPQVETESMSTYQRTMETEGYRQPSKEQWEQYHSAWQQYYQMYYERQYAARAWSAAPNTHQNDVAENSPIPSHNPESVSQHEAMRELRDSIRQKVATSAQKVKKSRHFIPLVAGIGVLLIFMFIQYNRVLVGAVVAYASPGSIEPQNIIVDPTVEVDVGPEPRMIIPKINIDAPVVYGVGPDHNSQMTAMEKGIAHFSIPGANAVPGQVGNAVFAAHSSNDVFARGDYKFVFAQNEKLTKGDIIYMNFEGKRYTYSVTTMEVVLPTEVSKVQINTDKPMLTLVSCVPLGTAEKRLLVYAEQVSPDPNQAVQAEVNDAAPESTSIPGRPSPTLFERIFGS